jgi:hypothetical protein
MKKEVGSKLANSVRQAKSKQPTDIVPVTSEAKAPSAPAEVVIEAQAAAPIISSRRVWPD